MFPIAFHFLTVAIWGPIYLGEAVFCGALCLDAGMASILPQVTVPFVAANLTQSLWCAAFRPSYSQGWHKYVSVMMLGSTAYSLSLIPFVDLATTTTTSSLYWIPLAMHFGWTTAATLVNLNGSLAMNYDVQESTMIAAGHASSVLATALGVGVTLSYQLPAYGLTIAWALAACAKGMRVSTAENVGAKIQKGLLTMGSIVSAGTAIYTLVV